MPYYLGSKQVLTHMKNLYRVIFFAKFAFVGALIGFLWLFFMPNSSLNPNWHQLKQAWAFYQQVSNEGISSTNNGSFQLSYADAIQKAGPSVVSVKAIRQGRARPATDGRKGDMLVDISVGVGSGVIFNQDGYIVTNYHVIAGSSRVAVHFSDGRRKYAQVVGFDQQNDIAVLKVNIKTPKVAELGDSSKVRTGDVVLAIGTPFGLFKNSVTMGIISAIDHGPFHPMIQTDASINYGNSGGALINAKGQVIGISSAKFSIEKNDEIGINFGTPIDTVKEIFTQLIKHGRVARNWLGVGLNQLNKAGHTHFKPGVEFGTGLLVSNIEKGSPGDLAGLKVEDFLIKFDGVEVKSMLQFRELFISTPIGKEVEIEVLREQKPVKLTLKLRERDA